MDTTYADKRFKVGDYAVFNMGLFSVNLFPEDEEINFVEMLLVEIANDNEGSYKVCEVCGDLIFNTDPKLLSTMEEANLLFLSLNSDLYTMRKGYNTTIVNRYYLLQHYFLGLVLDLYDEYNWDCNNNHEGVCA